MSQRFSRTPHRYRRFQARELLPVKRNQNRIVAFGHRPIDCIGSPQTMLGRQASRLFGQTFIQRYPDLARQKTDRLSEGYAPSSVVKNTGYGCRQLYQQQPDRWHQLVHTAMTQDWSWSRSALEYVSLYEQTIAGRVQSRE